MTFGSCGPVCKLRSQKHLAILCLFLAVALLLIYDPFLLIWWPQNPAEVGAQFFILHAAIHSHFTCLLCQKMYTVYSKAFCKCCSLWLFLSVPAEKCCFASGYGYGFHWWHVWGLPVSNGLSDRPVWRVWVALQQKLQHCLGFSWKQCKETCPHTAERRPCYSTLHVHKAEIYTTRLQPSSENRETQVQHIYI